MTENLKLYLDTFWFSPYSFSAFVSLTEKTVPFEIQEIALDKRENKEIDYRKQSVTGRIPAIQHGDFFLAESSAIIEYLDDIFKAPEFPRLLPADPKERARARMLLAWIRSSRDLMPLIKERSTASMFYQKATTPLSEQGEQAANKLIEVAEFLIPERQENLFSDWSIADSDLAFVLHRLIINEHPIPSRLKDYAEYHWARPSVRQFVERSRPPFVAY